MVWVLLVAFATGLIVALQPENGVKPSWNQLVGEYATLDYQTLARTIVKYHETQPNRIDVTFTSELNDTVNGLLLLPHDQQTPVPVVLLFHGLGGTRDEIVEAFGDEILHRGMAVFALDLPLHGARAAGPVDLHDNLTIRRVMYNGVRDWLVAIEWLGIQTAVESASITLLGYSLGSMIGVIAGALHPGISALALCVGGDAVLPRTARLPRRLRRLAWPIAPSLFAPKIAPRPVLMLNGLQDEVVQPAHAELLWANLGEPREIRWYNSGHRLPDEAGRYAVQWLQHHTAARANDI